MWEPGKARRPLFPFKGESEGRAAGRGAGLVALEVAAGWEGQGRRPRSRARGGG